MLPKAQIKVEVNHLTEVSPGKKKPTGTWATAIAMQVSTIDHTPQY